MPRCGLSSSVLPLSDGGSIPVVGLGTWKAAPGEVGEAVKSAIACGYRHIDCASVYGNEEEIGAALSSVLGSSDEAASVPRDQVFITTKVFNHCHTSAGVRASVARSLSDLRLEYVDLLLMHWPLKFKNAEFLGEDVPVLMADIPEKFRPLRQPNGHANPAFEVEEEFLETWKCMVAEQKAGRARHLGVSNFTVRQLEELLAFCDANGITSKPVVNQVEFHPLIFLEQKPLLEFCNAHSVVITAYSPLGSGDSYSGHQQKEAAPNLLTHEDIADIAQTHGRSTAQVLIRWSVQHQVSVIPKSSRADRIAQNGAVFDFKLSQTEMDRIDAISEKTPHRFGLGWMKGHFMP